MSRGPEGETQPSAAGLLFSLVAEATGDVTRGRVEAPRANEVVKQSLLSDSRFPGVVMSQGEG